MIYLEGKKMLEKRICLHCGNPFFAQDFSTQKYCCWDCMQQSRRVLAMKRKAERDKQLKK
jgi:hypothetical protein